MLNIAFSTKKYKNRVTKRPKIKTNEGKSDKTVQIIAHVVVRPDSTYPVVIKPYKLDLSQFTDKVRDKITFTITNVSDQKLDIEMISFSKDYFEVKLPSSIEAGGSAEGTLKLKKDNLEKSFEKSFTIELNDEKTSRFTIPVKRTVRKAAKTASSVGSTGSGK